MVKVNINWNKIREDLNTTLESYTSIIDLEEMDEVSALGNDIISVMKDHILEREDLEEKVKRMFDFFHDAILDIADKESEKWYDEFTKEFDKTWNDN